MRATNLAILSADGAKTRDEAIALIKANFAKSPAIRDHLKVLAAVAASGLSDVCAALMNDVFENHPEPLTRALAAKRLIAALQFHVNLGDRVKADPAARKRYEKAAGRAGVEKLLARLPKAVKSIEAYRSALRGELKGQLPDVGVGAAAPETIGANLAGRRVRLSDLKGKVVVLDFWAVWCGPCRRLIPHTRELVRGMAGRPFAFVGVCVDEKKETLVKFLEKEPMPWAHWWDARKKVTEQWDVSGFPTLYVIDHTGVIRFKALGYDPKSGKLDELVNRLVKAAEAAK